MPASLPMQLTSVKTLNGTNYKDWKESLDLYQNDLGDAFFVLGIQIHRDRSKGILGLSQRGCIEKVLKRFNMHSCSSFAAPIQKGDKLSKSQCPQDEKERAEMEKVTYASVVGSLMYAQVCTRPDISFVVNALGRYLSNPCLNHWKAVKKVMRYLQGTKDYMLTYKRSGQLEVTGYSDSDFSMSLVMRLLVKPCG